MGVIKSAIRFFLSSIFFFASLQAAPTLRLSSAAVGPLSVATGANGATRTVEAANIGDGSLSLSASGSASWMAPTVGAARPCTTAGFSGSCFPVQVAFQTSGLANGIYTGIVTVTDPNAVDSPQDITVTVQVGGGAPDSVDLYVQPGGAAGVTTFTTNSLMNGTAKTSTGGNWLSFSLTGVGSFRFSYPYRIAATPQPDNTEGAYSGTVVTTGSSLATENKTIAVTMHVTSQPIAQAAPASLAIRVAQGAPQQSYTVAIANSGLGTLAIGGVNTTASGGNWLSASNSGNTVTAVVDTSGTSPGTYQGSIAVSSNAANATLNIPVQLVVVPQGAPLATFQGTVDDAIFDNTSALAAGGLAALNGEQLTFGSPQQGTPPLTTSLGGAGVTVNGQPAPIVSVAYGQIVFQIPYETPPGFATVQVTRDGQTGNSVGINVASQAPRLLLLNGGPYGNIVNADGSYAIPADANNNHPAHPQDTLVVYGIGFGQTAPAAVTGSAATPDVPLELPVFPNVIFGGAFTGTPVIVSAQDARLVVGLVGVYQTTVVVPDDAPTGPSIALSMDLAGNPSNTVRVAIDPLAQ